MIHAVPDHADDGVLGTFRELAGFAEVARLEQLSPSERLNPEKLMEDLRLTGKPAAYLPTVDSILEHLVTETRSGDVVCIFSNGGFSLQPEFAPFVDAILSETAEGAEIVALANSAPIVAQYMRRASSAVFPGIRMSG